MRVSQEEVDPNVVMIQEHGNLLFTIKQQPNFQGMEKLLYSG